MSDYDYKATVEAIAEEAIERNMAFDEEITDAVFEMVSGSSYTFNTVDMKQVIKHTDNIDAWKDAYSVNDFENMSKSEQTTAKCFYAMYADVCKLIHTKKE